MRKTKNKWSTNQCGRCNQPHKEYTGKLDKDNVEYIVCGVTNKRMNVPNPYFELNPNKEESYRNWDNDEIKNQDDE